MGSYELTGPFGTTSVHGPESDHVISHAVKLRAERNTPHPLNPVGQLRRVVSSHYIIQDAVMLLGLQFFEIFTVVHEQHEPSIPMRKHIKSRILSVATGHLPALPKRLRRSEEGEEEVPAGSLQTLRSNLSDADYNSVEGILKDHVFSCGVAYAQVVKIKSSGQSVTVYYHPNTMKATKLSKNHLATSLRFTLCMESPEETTALLKDLEKRMARYNQAATFLGEEWVLPSAMHIVAVTCPLPAPDGEEQQAAELLLQKDPPWGATIAAPCSWGPEAAGSSTPLWAFLMTPLGYGKCEISPQTVSLYAKGNEASFYVGVRHPQVSGAALATTSRLQQLRPSDGSTSDEVESLDDGDDSDDSWQPEDADDSVPRPAAEQSAPSFSSASQPSLQRGSASQSGTPTSRSPGAISRGKAPSSHGVSGRHVRVHCHAQFVGPNRGKAGLTGPGQPAGLLLPGGLRLRDRHLALGAALLSCCLCTAFSWGLLFTALNLVVAAVCLRAPSRPRAAPEGATGAVVQALCAEESGKGSWHIRLLRAEIVTDEAWSAAGESILALVSTDGEDENSQQERHQRFAEDYGFSDDTVQRYLLAFQGDEVTAHRRMQATYEWRRANGVEGILKQPQPNFRFFKSMFRHGLLGVTKQGHPVWFMKVGDMKQGYKTFRDSALTSRDLARHVALCMDYMYERVESKPLPDGRALWVLDLKGMGMTDIGSDAFDLGKEIAGLISAHWPERLYRAFVINMPGFFSILWKLIEPMLAATTRRKIRLLRGKQDMLREMLEEMRIEDIPAEYGGKLQGEIYSSEQEQEFWAVAQAGRSSKDGS